MGAITIDIDDSATLSMGPTLSMGQISYSATGRAKDRPAPPRVEAPRRTWWLTALEPRLSELATLPAGWKGLGSERVSPAAVVDALNFLVDVMRDDTMLPWIGPLDNGGVELVWKRGDLEVEAIFDPVRGERQLLVSDGDSDRDAPIDQAGPMLADVVDRLASESVPVAA